MKCTIHGTEMEYTGEDPFGGDIWVCDACIAAEEYEFQRTSDDNVDPLWEEAELHAEAELENVADDLTDEQYAKALRETTQAQYKRLLEEWEKEKAYIATLTPEQKNEYFEWDGRKPPTDDDGTIPDSMYESDGRWYPRNPDTDPAAKGQT